MSVTAIDVLLNAFRLSAKIMYSFAEAWGEERIKELRAILKQNRDAEAAAWRRRDEGVAKPPRFKSEVIRQLIADHPMKSPGVVSAQRERTSAFEFFAACLLLLDLDCRSAKRLMDKA